MSPSSSWDAVKMRLCQVFGPVAIKVHAATQIYSRPQTADDILKEHILQFTDLIIHATGTDLTSLTCHITIILFIRHLFNKEIKKEVARGRISKC